MKERGVFSLNIEYQDYSSFAELYSLTADILGDYSLNGSNIDSLFISILNNITRDKIGTSDGILAAFKSDVEGARYSMYKNHSLVSQEVKGFVSKLHYYIEQNIAPINDFLQGCNIQVNSDFAEISAMVNYDINSENIK